jgi:hypothetical protein
MSQRNMNKIISKKGENEGREKNQFDKKRKDNKTRSKKNKKEWENFLTEDNKKERIEDQGSDT